MKRIFSQPLPCYSGPFACHSERSEESMSLAQDKLREESHNFLSNKIILTCIMHLCIIQSFIVPSAG